MADEKQPPAPPPLPGETIPEYFRRNTAPLGTPIPPRTPTPTADTKLLGDDGKKVVQKARAWGQALGILVAALTAASSLLVGAYRDLAREAREARVAVQAAKVETQKVKNEAESGYQVARPVLEEYDRRLRALELGRPPAPAQRRGRPRPAPPPPKVLPPDLAQALKAVTRAATPAPAERPPAPAQAPGAPADAGRPSGVP
jgi:hypothetical protein